MIRVKTKIQLSDLQGTMDKRTQKGQVVLDEQVLKDSNNYAPLDTSELINSAIRMSRIGEGQIIYSTPYARRLYFNPQYNFDRSKNSMAQGMWFEAAKANHLQDWISIVAKTMGGKV